MRILTILSGVLLILTSVWCFAHPGATFASLAFILGISMLVHGIAAILGYRAAMYREGSRGGVLTEGIITLALAFIVLSNQLAAEAVVPMFFGLWTLFSGATRITIALSLRKSEEKAWAWMLILGIAGTVAGVYAFFNSVAAGLTLVIMIGIFFILQGINMLTSGILMPGKKV